MHICVKVSVAAVIQSSSVWRPFPVPFNWKTENTKQLCVCGVCMRERGRDRDKISCNDRHSSFRFPFCPTAFYHNSISTNGPDQTSGGNATRSLTHSYSQTHTQTNTHPNPVFPETSNTNICINTKHTCGCTPITSTCHHNGIETVKLIHRTQCVCVFCHMLYNKD